MATEQLPDLLVVSSADFKEFLKIIGHDGQEAEPLSAVPLHNSTGVTVMVSTQVSEEVSFFRKDRRWYRVKKKPKAPTPMEGEKK